MLAATQWESVGFACPVTGMTTKILTLQAPSLGAESGRITQSYGASELRSDGTGLPQSDAISRQLGIFGFSKASMSRL